jgi:hypothetical protein
MCRVVYDLCRFCETEKLAFVDLCGKGRRGNICIDNSFQLRPGRELVDDTAQCLRAAVSLRHVRRRYTCSAYEALTTRVICVMPIAMATRDIDIRPAFTWSRHYYCPALLDAIYTAATSSLTELQHPLRNGDDLSQWEATPEDWDANVSGNVDGVSAGRPADHMTLRRITTANRFEHHDSLLDGGQMGRALLSQEQRERQQLGELIVMRRYLRDRLDARKIKEYKVVCEPDSSPTEHVRIALVVASTGGGLCRGTRLQHVALRVSEWERYFDVGHMRDDRRLCEPKGNSTLLWVNRGYGRKHPARNQEIAKLARRQYLE